MTYKIFASLMSDVNEGWVWLKSPDLPSRCIVRIRRSDTKRSIYCEALQFDDNFLRVYNVKPRFTITDQNSSLVVSSWYRARLGDLRTQQECELEVVAMNSCLGLIRSRGRFNYAA